MKLVTFTTTDQTTHAGIVHGERIVTLDYPTVLELLRDPYGLVRTSGGDANTRKEYTLNEVTLLSPILDPPSVRDFYAFEQHVKTARAKRGLDMIPEWYKVPIFYFTNTSEIYGHDQEIPYPIGSKELDFELEIACVIGCEGKDIPVDEASNYIAGYTIMNDWSARDFQRRDMQLNLGPGKGKDFATSLGPWLITPDELAPYCIAASAHEGDKGTHEERRGTPRGYPYTTGLGRYDMTMLARVNGKEISRGNFHDIHYNFPQMIAWASQNARLRIGDVLGSGTVGTGCLLELGTEVHPWLQPGDLIELEIEGIGVLRNRIV